MSNKSRRRVKHGCRCHPGRRGHPDRRSRHRLGGRRLSNRSRSGRRSGHRSGREHNARHNARHDADSSGTSSRRSYTRRSPSRRRCRKATVPRLRCRMTGPLVVNDNNSAGDQATASTVTGSNHDVAAAIGAGSSATDSAGDVHDRAFAGSAGSTAEVDYAGHSSATATGGATADINTSATAQEAGASALTAGVGGPTGTGDMHDTATATDTNNGGSVADVELSTNSKAIASATSAYGSDAEVSTSTHSEASATGYGGESGNDAAAIGSSDSKALASDTSGGGSSAEVLNAFDGSKSIATNDDNSYVENASHSTATGDDGTTFRLRGSQRDQRCLRDERRGGCSPSEPRPSCRSSWTSWVVPCSRHHPVPGGRRTNETPTAPASYAERATDGDDTPMTIAASSRSASRGLLRHRRPSIKPSCAMCLLLAAFGAVPGRLPVRDSSPSWAATSR